MELLNKIQKEIKVPKNHHNKFSDFYYRNCEDIFEAVKPLLGDAILTLNDEPVVIGDRFYMKAIATLKCGSETISCVGYAREPLNKKGMDEPQITGTASSYARKYAMNGLFCLDDAKSADAGKPDDKPEPEEIEWKDKQLDFAEKLKIALEENLDGEVIKLDEVKKFIANRHRATGNPIPEDPKDSNLIDPTVKFLLNNPETLKHLKGVA